MEANANKQPKRNKTTHLQPQNPTTSTPSSDIKEVFVFPPEIIIEILSRLPVKSLSRFSFISSSQFVKLHLKVSSSSKDYVHHKILSSFAGAQSLYLKQISLQSVMSKPVTESLDLYYPTKSPFSSPSIVGSCDGLVCIKTGPYLFIWNPTTGKFKNVPNSSMLDSRLGYLYRLRYGFGRDKLNDDYKVVGIFCSRVENENENNKVMVYSLRNDFWKSIGDLKGYGLMEEAGKYVNGKIHWTVRPSSDSRREIVSLDLATEVYGKVEQPIYGEFVSYLKLGVVSGYLCVLSQYKMGDMVLDLWVMRQYGVNESWTKMVSIPPLDKIVTIPPLDDTNDSLFSFPFCISKNGDVILVLNYEIAIYDPKIKLLWHPEITNFPHFPDVYEAVVYVESLVSPVADSESRREKQQ